MKHCIYLYKDGSNTSSDPKYTEDTYWFDDVEISKQQFDILELYCWYQRFYCESTGRQTSYSYQQRSELIQIVNDWSS